ncbi:MAG TPA: hypothetical protein VGK46_01740 [Saprospiraceae bacterium]
MTILYSSANGHEMQPIRPNHSYPVNRPWVNRLELFVYQEYFLKNGYL